MKTDTLTPELTGRHGIFNSYEAFIRIVDSMFSQHAKWLKVTSELPWRRKIASLNYLLASHIWQQDHNGFTHQDPDFLDHVINKKADIVRVYLPPDARMAPPVFSLARNSSSCPSSTRTVTTAAAS
jgi:xylulose-5-phosphate/fructose-6-phosphate phosphoketolase